MAAGGSNLADGRSRSPPQGGEGQLTSRAPLGPSETPTCPPPFLWQQDVATNSYCTLACAYQVAGEFLFSGTLGFTDCAICLFYCERSFQLWDPGFSPGALMPSVQSLYLSLPCNSVYTFRTAMHVMLCCRTHTSHPYSGSHHSYSAQMAETRPLLSRQPLCFNCNLRAQHSMVPNFKLNFLAEGSFWLTPFSGTGKLGQLFCPFQMPLGGGGAKNH